MRWIYLIGFVLFAFCATALNAQNAAETITIILVRHSEKELNAGDDPGLTAAGKMRAQKLATLFPNATPDVMYATPYMRTRETLAPWAEKTGITIKTYAASDLPNFAEELKTFKGKTIVVAGHSNTTPALANLLLNTDRYKAWEDEVYNKLFVITLSKGKTKSKLMEY